jgi:hypothetical protein
MSPSARDPVSVGRADGLRPPPRICPDCGGQRFKRDTVSGTGGPAWEWWCLACGRTEDITRPVAVETLHARRARERTCQVCGQECQPAQYAHGMCWKHYRAWQRAQAKAPAP